VDQQFVVRLVDQVLGISGHVEVQALWFRRCRFNR
jgi:hypothetical protein